MSARNGAKARFFLQRKARISRNLRTRELAKAAQEALKAKPEPAARPAVN